MIAPPIAPGICAADTLYPAPSSSLAKGLLHVHRSTGSKSSAFALAETLGAITALQQICQDAATAAVSAPGSFQAKAPTQEILQVLCEQSITVAGRKAVAVAISAVPGALHRLMVLMHVSHDMLLTTGHSVCNLQRHILISTPAIVLPSHHILHQAVYLH